MILLLSVSLAASEDLLITEHLLRVAEALREETPASLAEPARSRRLELLERLEAYAIVGDFPEGPRCPSAPRVAPPRAFQPPDRAGRAPLFVDAAGTHCAAGYLIALDAPELVQAIVAHDNDGYVLEMQTPGLAAWAAAHGFTAEELAWIQPSYPAVLEECADFMPRGTDPTGGEPTCEGMDVVVDRTGRRRATRACKDCGDAVQMWVPLWSVGSVDVTDLRVDIVGRDADTGSPGPSWSTSLCGITIPRGTGAAIGPIVVPDGLTWLNGRMRVQLTLPDGCEAEPPVWPFGRDLLNWYGPEACDTGWLPRDSGDHSVPDEGVGEALPQLIGLPCPDPPPTDDTDASPADDTDAPTSGDTDAPTTGDTDPPTGGDTDLPAPVQDTADEAGAGDGGPTNGAASVAGCGCASGDPRLGWGVALPLGAIGMRRRRVRR
jgi:hypothetical protein